MPLAPTPVTVRGVTYPSLVAASKALGVHVTAVCQAKARGTLDYIGLRPLKTSSIITALEKATPEDLPRLREEARKWILHRDRQLGMAVSPVHTTISN